jgi:NADH-quinone oxidoreductase subunit L
MVLSGMPPLFGFLEHAGMALAGHVWAQALLGLTFLLTSLYVWRLLWLVFLGKARSTTLRPAQGRQTTRLATVVIIAVSILVLTGGAAAILPLIAAGRSGLLTWGLLKPTLSAARLLNGELPHTIIIIATAAVSLLGFAAVWLTHRRTGVQLHREKEQGPLRRLLASGYHGTEGYELVVSGMRRFGRGLWTYVDTLFLDLACSRGPAAVLASGGWIMARLHTGQIAWYLLAVAAAACLCALWMVM